MLNKRLADREFISGDDYTIADMASYPWVVSHQKQSQDLNDFPNLKRWFEAISERPATKKAYASVEEVNPTARPFSAKEKELLFGIKPEEQA